MIFCFFEKTGGLGQAQDIERSNRVWSTDITYAPMRYGFMYLIAVMGWFSRYVISWELSNSMDNLFVSRLLSVL